jgi:4-aminobutyrate aminotransferase
MEFTHQGAAWTDQKDKSGVSWGSESDRLKIQQDFARVAAWAKEKNRPIFLGEFGAYCALAERHGILYVADEVQSGIGRTGKMWAIDHWGVEPDIVCTAKGLASGLPLGAMIAKAEVMNWEQGAHASTFGGNPVACVAALETIALVEEGLMQNATDVGNYLLGRLRELATRHPLIGDVRGLGLMIGVDLVKNRATKETAPIERDAILQHCFTQGLVILGCGESAIRLCPALVVTREEAETAVRILDTAIAEVVRTAAMAYSGGIGP